MSESAGFQRKRPWLAAALAVVVPGLGHVYARSWLRAALWFVLFVASVQLLVPADATGGALSLGAFSEFYGDEPGIAVFLAVLSALNVLDAYVTVSRLNERLDRQTGDTTVCPTCGKELDEDLAFCHWCTTRLGDRE